MLLIFREAAKKTFYLEVTPIHLQSSPCRQTQRQVIGDELVINLRVLDENQLTELSYYYYFNHLEVESNGRKSYQVTLARNIFLLEKKNPLTVKVQPYLKEQREIMVKFIAQ